LHYCACSSKRVLLLTKPSLPFWLHAPACLPAALQWGPCGDRPGAPAQKHNHSGGLRPDMPWVPVPRASDTSRRREGGVGGGVRLRTGPCRGEGSWWPPRCYAWWWRRPRYSHGIPAHMHGTAAPAGTAAGVRQESGTYVNMGRAATGAPPPRPPQGAPRPGDAGRAGSDGPSRS
jgi:hypothetical protein